MSPSEGDCDATRKSASSSPRRRASSVAESLIPLYQRSTSSASPEKRQEALKETSPQSDESHRALRNTLKLTRLNGKLLPPANESPSRIPRRLFATPPRYRGACESITPSRQRVCRTSAGEGEDMSPLSAQETSSFAQELSKADRGQQSRAESSLEVVHEGRKMKLGNAEDIPSKIQGEKTFSQTPIVPSGKNKDVKKMRSTDSIETNTNSALIDLYSDRPCHGDIDDDLVKAQSPNACLDVRDNNNSLVAESQAYKRERSNSSRDNVREVDLKVSDDKAAVAFYDQGGSQAQRSVARPPNRGQISCSYTEDKRNENTGDRSPSKSHQNHHQQLFQRPRGSYIEDVNPCYDPEARAPSSQYSVSSGAYDRSSYSPYETPSHVPARHLGYHHGSSMPISQPGPRSYYQQPVSSEHSPAYRSRAPNDPFCLDQDIRRQGVPSVNANSLPCRHDMALQGADRPQFARIPSAISYGSSSQETLETSRLPLPRSYHSHGNTPIPPRSHHHERQDQYGPPPRNSGRISRNGHRPVPASYQDSNPLHGSYGRSEYPQGPPYPTRERARLDDRTFDSSYTSPPGEYPVTPRRGVPRGSRAEHSTVMSTKFSSNRGMVPVYRDENTRPGESRSQIRHNDDAFRPNLHSSRRRLPTSDDPRNANYHMNSWRSDRTGYESGSLQGLGEVHQDSLDRERNVGTLENRPHDSLLRRNHEIENPQERSSTCPGARNDQRRYLGADAPEYTSEGACEVASKDGTREAINPSSNHPEDGQLPKLSRPSAAPGKVPERSDRIPKYRENDLAKIGMPSKRVASVRGKLPDRGASTVRNQAAENTQGLRSAIGRSLGEAEPKAKGKEPMKPEGARKDRIESGIPRADSATISSPLPKLERRNPQICDINEAGAEEEPQAPAPVPSKNGYLKTTMPQLSTQGPTNDVVRGSLETGGYDLGDLESYIVDANAACMNLERSAQCHELSGDLIPQPATSINRKSGTTFKRKSDEITPAPPTEEDKRFHLRASRGSYAKQLADCSFGEDVEDVAAGLRDPAELEETPVPQAPRKKFPLRGLIRKRKAVEEGSPAVTAEPSEKKSSGSLRSLKSIFSRKVTPSKRSLAEASGAAASIHEADNAPKMSTLPAGALQSRSKFEEVEDPPLKSSFSTFSSQHARKPKFSSHLLKSIKSVSLDNVRKTAPAEGVAPARHSIGGEAEARGEIVHTSTEARPGRWRRALARGGEVMRKMKGKVTGR